MLMGSFEEYHLQALCLGVYAQDSSQRPQEGFSLVLLQQAEQAEI